MTIKGFKLAPVAWMTTILSVLGAIEAANAAVHFLPAPWSAALAVAVVVLTAVLGALAHNRVTPTAAPHDDAGTPLVPVAMRGTDAAAPPTSRGGGIGGAGMHSW